MSLSDTPPFPFLKLPIELRQMVLDHLFIDDPKQLLSFRATCRPLDQLCVNKYASYLINADYDLMLTRANLKFLTNISKKDKFRLKVRKLVVCTAHLSEHDFLCHKVPHGCNCGLDYPQKVDMYAAEKCQLKEERYRRHLSEQEKFIRSSDPVDVLSEALKGLDNCSSVVFTDKSQKSEEVLRRPAGLTELESDIGVNLRWTLTYGEDDKSKTSGSEDFFKAALKIVLLAMARSGRIIDDIDICVSPPFSEEYDPIRPSFLRFPQYERLFQERLRGLESLAMVLDSSTVRSLGAPAPDLESINPVQDDSTAQDVLDFLKIWPNLLSLSIKFNGYSDDDGRLFPELAASLHHPNLVELAVYGATITWNELNTIVQKHGALKRLDLREVIFKDFDDTDLRTLSLAAGRSLTFDLACIGDNNEGDYQYDPFNTESGPGRFTIYGESSLDSAVT
ncbi:nacht nucleoside triphosphatase [Purpureocillium lavendulum]|uniref:Nacht nucleoside triphosphatase n=1 Tax=Purpureocillium lavendulum TaxID=1247861 RepID=A0AB34FIT1_9HYPO|nr:nacht nucleoside triphosphatase [Purpureocillium lavendulum]